jgi:hypothetical protein
MLRPHNGLRHILIAGAAVAAVYVSSPARYPSAQGSSAGTDQIYAGERLSGGEVHGKTGHYRLDSDGVSTLIGPLSMPSVPECNLPRTVQADVAPDGTLYGVITCDDLTERVY